LVFFLRKDITLNYLIGFILVQSAGGLCGTILAHAMFDLPLLTASLNMRSGTGQWIGEAVATFGLVATILAGVKFRAEAVPMLVGLYISAGYWFTSSTSFANPAVTLARGYSDSFAGIRPIDMPGFWGAQILGALLALWIMSWLLKTADKDV